MTVAEPKIVATSITRATEENAKDLSNRLGVGAAIFSATVQVGSSIAMITWIGTNAADYSLVSLVTYLFWWLIAPSLIIVMLCIHDWTPANKKILSSIGVAFLLVYTVIASFNYFTQLTVMRFQNIYGTISGLTLFYNGNLHSVVWEMEAIEYGFQGLAFFFVAPLFSGNRLQNSIRYMFIINAVNGIIGTAMFALDLNWSIGIGTFVVWMIALPLLTGMLAVNFNRELKHSRLLGSRP